MGAGIEKQQSEGLAEMQDAINNVKSDSDELISQNLVKMYGNALKVDRCFVKYMCHKFVYQDDDVKTNTLINML